MPLGIIIKSSKRIAEEGSVFTEIMRSWDDPLVVPVKTDGLSDVVRAAICPGALVLPALYVTLDYISDFE